MLNMAEFADCAGCGGGREPDLKKRLGSFIGLAAPAYYRQSFSKCFKWNGDPHAYPKNRLNPLNRLKRLERCSR